MGRLLTVDARRMQFREFKIERDIQCTLCGDRPENLCYPKEVLCMSEVIPEISIQELAEWQKEGRNFLLLDVREPSEYAECEMGGKLIPIGELPNRINELNPATQTIVHCRGGGRSKRAAALLKEAGFQDVRNLTGGITAWMKAKEN
jgi:adenylyltransferase/sulfurtransferase